MQTEKEQIQNQIQELQEKLKKLEEKEPEMMLLRQGKVDFVDYKKNTYMRIEYTDSFSGVYKWYQLEKFHQNLIPIKHQDLADPLEKFYQDEVVKQKEEYPYKVDETQKKSVCHITDEHGETNPFKMYLNSLKDENKMEELGFVKNSDGNWTAQPMEELGFVKNSDGNWTAQPLGETPQERGERVHKETQELEEQEPEMIPKRKEKFDFADFDMNPYLRIEHEYIDEMVAELKGQTLYDLIADWWDEIFTNGNPSGQNIETLVETVEKWLPKEQSANSQNAYVECTVEGFNDCLQKIKSRLR